MARPRNDVANYSVQQYLVMFAESYTESYWTVGLVQRAIRMFRGDVQLGYFGSSRGLFLEGQSACVGTLSVNEMMS